MTNIIIIQEFEKLVNSIQNDIDIAKINKDAKKTVANTFRLKQTKNALAIIKKYPKELTIETLEEFSQFQGIGKGTIDRIKEIINQGYLTELVDFKDTTNINSKALEDLESIVGVGRTTALEWIKQGITSVEQLKSKIDKGELVVNDKILLGIKYYGKFFGNIPRTEIIKINKILKQIIKKMNSHYKLDLDSKYVFEICGSFRREKPTSGDIDVLISKLDTNMDTKDDTPHLERFIKELKNPIKTNDNQPLIVDDITDKSYKTKYMGFAKYKDKPFRRIDIRFVPWSNYHSALLYFTGSAELNLKMRKIAKSMNMKLSEYGLTKSDGTMILSNSEYDIFKILKIEYLPPNLR